MTPTAWRWGGVLAAALALGLGVWAFLESWSSEVILGVLAVYVSIGGFAIAIAEIKRATTVTKATQKAVKKTLTGVAASRLGITITQLRQTVEDLEQATIARDPVGARRAVNAWRNLASEVQGPLLKRFPGNDVIPSLHRSIEQGQLIKGALATAKKEPLYPITENALISMEQVGNQLAALIDELTPTVDDNDE